jgi:hypothetical protein
VPAAHRDAGQDRDAADDLTGPGRIAEDHHARDGADHRLDVHERAGDLGGHALLPVGEERERRQRPGHRERQRREDRGHAGRGG